MAFRVLEEAALDLPDERAAIALAKHVAERTGGTVTVRVDECAFSHFPWPSSKLTHSRFLD